MKTKLLLVYSLLALSLSPMMVLAQAQPENAPKVWTLKECIDYALANNLDVQRSELTVESSEIDKVQAKMAMIPSLNASVSNNFNWGRSINPVTNEFTTQEIRSLSPNASSSVTLFNGFRIQNTIKQTNIGYLASEQDLLKSKNDVSLNVINLYINVIFNKELTENAKSQLRSSQQQLERTRKQVAAGALPKSNELNLDAQVATNEVNVITNENLLNLSLLQLKQALQLPGSTALDVEVPELSVEDLVLDQSSQQVFEIAKLSMPEIKSADLKVRASYYGVKAARGQLYPRLSLNANINSNYSSANDAPRLTPDGGSETQLITVGYWDNAGSQVPVFREQTIPTGTMSDGYGYSDQLNDNLFRSVGISLSIPLFNGYQARGGVRRAEITRLNAEISAKQVNQALRQNVESAFNDANAASKSYQANVRQVQAREEAYRMTSQRYELGAANYVEYQVAENDLFQAKSDLTRAKYNFIFRKKLLDFYQGKPLGF
jgi:outer membrane protein